MIKNNRIGVVSSGGETSGIPTLKSLHQSGLKTFLFTKNRSSIICRTKNITGGIFTISDESPFFLEKIKYICLKYKIFKLIILDEEMKYLFIRKIDLLKKIDIVLPSIESYEIAFRKSSSSEFARKIGIPVPKTFYVNNRLELFNLKSSFNFPLVVKGERGNSSEHVRYAHNFDELVKYFDEISKLEKNLDSSLSNPIIQEYIGGPTYLSQAICHNGDVKAVIPHYKFREWPLSGGVTARAKTIEEPKLVKYMTKMLESLKWNGEAGMEWKYDKKRDDYYFLEMNPRFEGSLDLAINSGINFPCILVDILNNKKISNLNYRRDIHYRWFFTLDFRCFLYGNLSFLNFFKEALNSKINGEGHLNDINVLTLHLKGLIYEILNFIRNKK